MTDHGTCTACGAEAELNEKSTCTDCSDGSTKSSSEGGEEAPEGTVSTEE